MYQDIYIRGFRWDDLEAVTRLFNSVNGSEDTAMESDVELMGQVLAQPSVSPEDDLRLAHIGDDLGGVLPAPPGDAY